MRVLPVKNKENDLNMSEEREAVETRPRRKRRWKAFCRVVDRIFGFFLAAGLALGVFASQYDPYTYSNEITEWYYYDYAGKPDDFRTRSHVLLWLGPTRIWFSIGYDLFKHKVR